MAFVLFHSRLSQHHIVEATIWAAVWASGFETSVATVLTDATLRRIAALAFARLRCDASRTDAYAVYVGMKDLLSAPALLSEMRSAIAGGIASCGRPVIPEELKRRAVWALPIVVAGEQRVAALAAAGTQPPSGAPPPAAGAGERPHGMSASSAAAPIRPVE